MTTLTFNDFGLSPSLVEALVRKGFEEPTPIQALAIPRLLQGSAHLLAKARTGTGKTAAFGLPLVERLAEPQPKVRAIVLVPRASSRCKCPPRLPVFAPRASPA